MTETIERPPTHRLDAVGVASASVAAAGAAVACATVGLGGPVALLAGAAGTALAGAGFALGRFTRPAPNRGSTHALAATRFDGTLIGANAAFHRLMDELGRPAHPDALAVDDASALALYALRRAALAGEPASGPLAASALVTVERQGDTLVHRLERLRDAAPPTPEATLTLVDALPFPVAASDGEGRILRSNAAFRQLLGDPSGDGAEGGRGPSARLADLVAEPFAMERLLAGADRGAPRVDVSPRAAPARTVRLSAKPLGLWEGVVLVAATDVTEQSAMEAEMAKRQKMLAVGQLAGNIAHDFNNVLAAIIGFSDLLLQTHRANDPAFSDIMSIKQSAQRAARLVKQLLAFSRRQTLRPTVVSLNDAIADLATMLDRLLGEKVRLQIDYGRDLWPVLADLAQVEQVVINLAVNARDAMPGGGTVRIAIANVPRGAVEGDEGPIGDSVLLKVADNGTGMSPEVMENVFEPFFTTKAPGEGTGLGLSTVYGVVKQTGGTLTLTSAPGEGTEFCVYLPRHKEAAAPEPAAPRPTAVNADLTGSATLLLVEDEEAVRAFAARALAAKGYRVLEAASGIDALDIYEAENGAIDLLLSDVIMPELDGPTLVKRLRERRADLKVVLMSGYADGAGVEDLGSLQFLEKPFTLKALVQTVAREIGSGRE